MQPTPTYSIPTPEIQGTSPCISKDETHLDAEAPSTTEQSHTTTPSTENFAKKGLRAKKTLQSANPAEDRLALNIMIRRLAPCGARVEEIDGRTHIILPDFIRHIVYDGGIRFVPRIKYKEDEQ